MGSVNDFVGAVGGTIVCLELIVVLILVVAINGGVAFGLWWVLKHMKSVHEKVVWATRKYESVLDKGLNVAASPVIRTTSFWRGFKAGLYRVTHWPGTVKAPESTGSIVPATESAGRSARAA